MLANGRDAVPRRDARGHQARPGVGLGMGMRG
jgi:hypothetical protein